MIQKDILQFLTYLKSAQTAQKYLEECYEKNEIKEANKYSYENSDRFLYYLEHGLQFYEAGKASGITVKPILYFYGMVHLLKACLLTRKPNYPENTAMLAHGVSTRKRKKQDYAFLQDEVKVQHKGLFPYFVKHLYHMDRIPYEKIDMHKLLVTIPELNELFYFHTGKHPLIKVSHLHEKKVHIPTVLLDHYHLTEESLLEKLMKHLPDVEHVNKVDSSLEIELSRSLTPDSKGPFFFHMEESAFFLPGKRQYFLSSHEVMHHYLILYNLSMICRYETEWWGDLLHTMPTEDYPFIEQFLSVTSEKVPILLGYFLLNEKGVR
ncbi:YaaC family protein [Aquibacillus koreensis]|uniref:YaaC family protein n=1 Tax=Aquibacillus koreensis TaxID=279446 RepID=A0A9X3WMF1_9BACI|nr:YaaC family protein [Aquibacillus koreensis]MCT2536955.1 YaaC family protein [Aquibacillus koreensis]MDC3422742.1 YaaC family protein [Aquibacillus koreensis]